jgi:hypothetical protein
MSGNEWIQVVDDVPVADGRASLDAWLDKHGVTQDERGTVARVEVVRTTSGDVLRLLVRADYLRSRELEM